MRKTVVSFTLGLAENAILDYLARAHHEGNKSEALRQLLNEAAAKEHLRTIPIHREVVHVKIEKAPMGA